MVLIDHHIHVTCQCVFFVRNGKGILGVRLGFANIFAEDS